VVFCTPVEVIGGQAIQSGTKEGAVPGKTNENQKHAHKQTNTDDDEMIDEMIDEMTE